MPVWIMFSTICICFSTSISRSAACTCRLTPSRSAASCAPRRMSTKKGWFSVLSTSATVGLSEFVVAGPRLHDTDATAATRMRAKVLFITTLRQCPPSGGPALRPMLSLQHRVEQHGDHDHAADDDLLEKRRDAEQVEAVAQHAHDQGADQRAAERALAAHQAGAADHSGGDRGPLVVD